MGEGGKNHQHVAPAWVTRFHSNSGLSRWSFGCLCGCLLIVNATFTLLSPIFPQVHLLALSPRISTSLRQISTGQF